MESKLYQISIDFHTGTIQWPKDLMWPQGPEMLKTLLDDWHLIKGSFDRGLDGYRLMVKGE